MNHKVRARRGQVGAAALTLALATAAGSLVTTSPALAQGAGQPAASTVPLFVGNWQLQKIKARAATWVTERTRSLDAAMAAVQSYSFLGADGTTLTSDMQADVTGLEALNQKIQSDTTVAEARADALDIFTQFRVYSFMLPVVSYVVATDRVDNVYIPDLNSDISYLQGQENSSNQGVIGPLVAGMQSEVQAATSATSGLASQLLSYTPADWDANHGLLGPARSSVLTAERAVFMAEREYYQALSYLNHHPATTTTTTTTSTSTSTTSTSVPVTSTTAPPAELARIQQRAAAAVLVRLASLNTAIALVQAKAYLGSDGATLVADMQADESALQAVLAKVDADTTVAAALADYEQIFSGFRVYDLVIPVVDDVIRVDYLDNVAIPQVNQEITQLQAQVDSSNQAVIDPLITGMEAQVQVISTTTAGLSAQLLSYTATEWDANQQLLAGANTNIAAANRALATAQFFYKRALAYLREGPGKDRSPRRGPHRPTRKALRLPHRGPGKGRH
jgi:hypothetical protein